MYAIINHPILAPPLLVKGSSEIFHYCYHKFEYAYKFTVRSQDNKVQNEVTPCKQCEDLGPCKKRENLFNYSMVTRNLIKLI